jgi:hypothetical protein
MQLNYGRHNMALRISYLGRLGRILLDPDFTTRGSNFNLSLLQPQMLIIQASSSVFLQAISCNT